eukprot:UN32740
MVFENTELSSSFSNKSKAFVTRLSLSFVSADSGSSDTFLTHHHYYPLTTLVVLYSVKDLKLQEHLTLVPLPPFDSLLVSKIPVIRSTCVLHLQIDFAEHLLTVILLFVRFPFQPLISLAPPLIFSFHFQSIEYDLFSNLL